MPRSLALSSSDSSEDSYGSDASFFSSNSSDAVDAAAGGPPPGADANMEPPSDTDDLLASDNEHAPAPMAGCGPPPPATAASVDKDYHFRLKKQSFTDELLKGLCWRQLERELKEKFPARQAAAQYREYRKGHARDSPRTLLYNVSEFLSQERRNDLEHMSAALRCMLEEDMQDNDLYWLEHLPEGPMPDRLVAMQHFSEGSVHLPAGAGWNGRCGDGVASLSGAGEQHLLQAGHATVVADFVGQAASGSAAVVLQIQHADG